MVLFGYKTQFNAGAASAGHVDAVQTLINNRASVNPHSDFGWTPLHMATRAGHAEVVLVLLQAGANVNAKNSDGDTPLHVAASRFTSDVTTINHLLHHGKSCYDAGNPLTVNNYKHNECRYLNRTDPNIPPHRRRHYILTRCRCGSKKSREFVSH